jgi:hypothetical protein
MTEHQELGQSPCNEECTQLGTPDYPEKSRIECRVYARQIERVCGEPPDGAWLGVKSFSHDFGTYREVCVFWDDSIGPAAEYAYALEDSVPLEWDDTARAELAEAFAKLENVLSGKAV